MTTATPVASPRQFTFKGQTFTSILTNAEAIEMLKAAVSDGMKSTFAASLVRQWINRGGLTNNQWPWVHKLVNDLTNPQPERTIENTALTGLVALIEKAHEKLKYPKITVEIEGIKFQISRAGDKAKFPGSLNITDGGRYGSNVWYGRIHKDGKLEASHSMTGDIRKRLDHLNSDPAKFAAVYGQLTGSCCFCNSPLSTDESTTVGYGPVCAKNWGLPWTKAEVAAAKAECACH